MIKLFGSGYWQYRAWPLLAFTLMLFLSFLVVWRIGGTFALCVFFVWLWVIPQFTTQFAYESFSEDIAFLFLLAGYYLLFLMVNSKKNILLSFLAGVSLSLCFLTKTLLLIAVPGIFVFMIQDYLFFHENKKYLLKKWLVLALGAIIPVAAFYSYGYIFMVSHFGVKGWNAVVEDNRLSYNVEGAGLGTLSSFFHQNLTFLYAKFIIWMDIGSNFPFAMWILFLLSPVIFFRYGKPNEKMLCSGLYIAAFISFFWFMFISTDGWARHVWQGLIIAMMLISIIAGLFQRYFHSEFKNVIWVIVCIVVLVFVNYPVLSVSPVLSDSAIATWAVIRVERRLDGFPSNDLYPLHDQEQVITYFDKHIKPQDRVYYVSGFLVAEISPLVDKIFYPLKKYNNDHQTNLSGGKSYAILGPYQRGFWTLVPSNYSQEVVSIICGKVVMENNSYLLCELKRFSLKEYR
jgi:hypothetical protein